MKAKYRSTRRLEKEKQDEQTVTIPNISYDGMTGSYLHRCLKPMVMYQSGREERKYFCGSCHESVFVPIMYEHRVPNVLDGNRKARELIG